MIRSLSLVTVLHLVANAVLLSVGYYWLGVGESRTLTLLWSILLALFFALFACCAYSAPLAWFRKPGPREIAKAWRSGFRNLLPFVFATAAIAAVVLLLNTSAAKPPAGAKKWAIWIGEWIVLPVLFLPMLSAISERGWQGFRAAGSRIGQWLFWIEAPLLLMLTIRVPLILLNWIPRVRTFTMQAASFTARAALAYLVFGAGWLLLAFVTSAGTPRLTQSSTADSP
jgi:hypothetical protein